MRWCEQKAGRGVAIDRWQPKRVLVVSDTGAQTDAEAEVPIMESPSVSVSVLVAVVIAGTLLVIGLFVPPVLLLNIPILLLRAWLGRASTERMQAVRMRAFTCPACANANGPVEQRGELPIRVSCSACSAALSVRSPPRRNLATSAPV